MLATGSLLHSLARLVLISLAIVGGAAIILGQSSGVISDAFADSSLLPAHASGEGSAAISGYDVSGIGYTLDTTSSPTRIAGIKFRVTAAGAHGAPSHVQVKLHSGDNWHTCSNVKGNLWQCTLEPAVPLAAADGLTVVAWQ